MKLEITTTAKRVETVNYILGQAINALKENPKTREAFELSTKEVEDADKFRKHLIDVYLKPPKKTNDTDTESKCNKHIVSGSVFIEKPIPDKMLKAKDFVVRYTIDNNKPPSYWKIAKHFGISRTAAYHRMKYFRELMSKTDRTG